MPTYRNDNTDNTTFPIMDTDGNLRILEAGQTVESYEQHTGSGLTKTLDTPYYNPLLRRESLDFDQAEAQTITLTADQIAAAKSIKIHKVKVANFSVYISSQSNTPALAVLAAGEEFEMDIEKNIDALVIVSDGEGYIEVEIKK